MQKLVVNVIYLAILVLCLPSQTFAATLKLEATKHCNLKIDGPITSGDFKDIMQLKGKFIIDNGESTSATVVCLNSIGGNFYEGLKIARFFYEEGVGTHISENDECYSICAVMFMMGRAKGGEVDYANRTLNVLGKLGFHRPYLTLDDARAYSSGDINSAFDEGVGGVFNLIDLANMPVPWGSGTMIPHDLLSAMLGTPPDKLFLIENVEDTIRWGIQLDGIAAFNGLEKQTAAFYACENALSSMVARPSALYGGKGLMSSEVFYLRPLPDYSIRSLLGENSAWVDGDLLSVSNLRSGYAGAGCTVKFHENAIGLCGQDGTTNVRIGSCIEGPSHYENWHYTIALHPKTQISTLLMESTSLNAVRRYVRCVVTNENGEMVDDEICLQTVNFKIESEKAWSVHTLLWPSGSLTVVEILAGNSRKEAAYLLNGDAGVPTELPENDNCLKNSATGNILCLSADGAE